METPAKQSRARRLRGWFTPRLSDRSKAGRHRTFRGVPDFFRLAVESPNEYALITMDKDRVISSWSGPLLFTPEDIAKGIDRQEFASALEKGRQDDDRGCCGLLRPG